MNTVIVVTRYGGKRHLADVGRQQDDGRFLTLCRGTSSWTINSWRRFPDHPSLTPDQMDKLPVCGDCAKTAAGSPEPRVVDAKFDWTEGEHESIKPVTSQSQADEVRRWSDGSTVSREQATEAGFDWNLVCLYTEPVPEPEPEPESKSEQWVAVIARRTVGWVDKIVGPFGSEAEAQAWLDSMQKPGGPVKMTVLS